MITDMTSVLQSLEIDLVNQSASTGKKWYSALNGITKPIISPVDGKKIAEVTFATNDNYDLVMASAQGAFLQWRKMPAPKRGDIIRQLGDELRIQKENLGKLVSYEMGKSLQEGLGEVQEMIDICDFAVGLSRQLYGLSMHSERPMHRMYEQYHPLGVVGIISAFNFPVAVWCWNTAIALVCGNVCIWKPSEKTPLSAIACQKILQKVLDKNELFEGICSLIIGDRAIGEKMATDKNIALLSATGSTRMGKSVAKTVASRLGKYLLELGGNNAIIITENADKEMSLLGAVFGAVGTAGQRCTSTRRLIIHENVYDYFKEKLVHAYQQLKIGNPLIAENHVGPLIDNMAVENYLAAIEKCKQQGGNFIVGGGVLEGEEFVSGCYVKPCIAEVENHYEIVQNETFAPILYLMKYQKLEDAIDMQNNVPQGLSSAIMTTDLKEAEQFLSVCGSDCGIANVNIGTSGAEIGGAFGGEKETGGGREAGSDCWKTYMRRQTNTINYSSDLPLAQGIQFKL